jgi:hypothetical protein
LKDYLEDLSTVEYDWKAHHHQPTSQEDPHVVFGPFCFLNVCPLSKVAKLLFKCITLEPKPVPSDNYETGNWKKNQNWISGRNLDHHPFFIE